MNRLQKILIIPIVIPICTVIFVGVLNLNKPVTFRLLAWRTPATSMGLWMAIGASSGGLLGLLSSLPSSYETLALKRKVRKRIDINNNPFFTEEDEVSDDLEETINSKEESLPITEFPPERDLRDPAPTVSVPYRVIQNKKRVASVEYANIEAEDSYHEKVDYYDEDIPQINNMEMSEEEKLDWQDQDFEHW
ncbi:hypothetical protein [Prochlorococcus sp. MIT 1300]|uniref:hypothetical protein n=1 Tax=Prochlorococcus sp. MIT 1300 TaxID=3096218 RepID=UPI002A7593B0|nr:hypothetical protein [Prochlorococcus sp. MIT 1300]